MFKELAVGHYFLRYLFYFDHRSTEERFAHSARIWNQMYDPEKAYLQRDVQGKVYVTLNMRDALVSGSKGWVSIKGADALKMVQRAPAQRSHRAHPAFVISYRRCTGRRLYANTVRGAVSERIGPRQWCLEPIILMA